MLQLAARSLNEALDQMERADGFCIGTGSYWDSWGSPLQKFLEDMAGLDLTSVLFGKPAGLVTTCHSVGGKSVLNRLQGVLNSMGLWVPPHGAMSYSMVSHEAKRLGIDIVAHNLAEAVEKTFRWKSWPVSNEPDEAFRQRWLERGLLFAGANKHETPAEDAAHRLQQKLDKEMPQALASVGVGSDPQLFVYVQRGHRISKNKIPDHWEGIPVKIVKTASVSRLPDPGANR